MADLNKNSVHAVKIFNGEKETAFTINIHFISPFILTVAVAAAKSPALLLLLYL